jgi:hypothetical protein
MLSLPEFMVLSYLIALRKTGTQNWVFLSRLSKFCSPGFVGEPVPATLPPAINQALIAPATPEKRSLDVAYRGFLLFFLVWFVTLSFRLSSPSTGSKPSRTNSKVGAESPKPKNPALEKVKSVTMGSQKPKDKTRRKVRPSTFSSALAAYTIAWTIRNSTYQLWKQVGPRLRTIWF